MGMPIPNNSASRDHLRDLITATAHIEGGWEGLPTSGHIIALPSRIVDLMATVPAGTVPLRRLPHLRAPVEDYATASLGLLTDMAEHTGGLKIDHYLQGNIQNMIAHYELTENA
ncbi:MAG: hypothetical protein ACREGG_01450 [Candidatus Saccharimonadales bacterium]